MRLARLDLLGKRVQVAKSPLEGGADEYCTRPRRLECPIAHFNGGLDGVRTGQPDLGTVGGAYGFDVVGGGPNFSQDIREPGAGRAQGGCPAGEIRLDDGIVCQAGHGARSLSAARAAKASSMARAIPSAVPATPTA